MLGSFCRLADLLPGLVPLRAEDKAEPASSLGSSTGVGNSGGLILWDDIAVDLSGVTPKKCTFFSGCRSKSASGSDLIPSARECSSNHGKKSSRVKNNYF